MDIDEPVELSPYDRSWPRLARAEVARLRQVLPVHARLEHIGSTAVPGCESKPIVDLLVGTPSEERIAVAHAVEAAGYEPLGEAEPGRIYLRRRAPSFNVHVVELGGRLWLDNLYLRELLRSDAAARARYVEAKRRALALEPNLLGYSREKSTVLLELLRVARRRPTPP
jgi:GrpB-like predicted nucleotidyltransferase (UPF0157 family)